MSGPFIPDDFEPQVNSPGDVKLAAIAWGFTLGFGYLTCSKALKQTRMVWKRSHRINTYVALIWIEVFSSLTYGILAWLMMDNTIPMKYALSYHFHTAIKLTQSSFYALFVMVVAWSFEIQALLQIIINRVSLLIIDKRKAAYITWGVAFIMTLINISVFIVWIPARLQISDRWVSINNIWDRIEKGIYLVVDGCLNAYFLYLVHSKLVAAGMTKYRPLFKFNAFIVFISLSMDVLIISMMNMKNSWVYTLFHPLAYIVKLNIELTMASLITKIAKQPGGIYGSSKGHTIEPSDNTKGGHVQHASVHISSRGDAFLTSMHDEHGRRPTYDAWVKGPQAQAEARHIEKQRRQQRAGPADLEELSDSDESFQPESPPAEGNNDAVIVKTTELAITTESIELSEREVETQSEHESTTDLNQHRDWHGQSRDQERVVRIEKKA